MIGRQTWSHREKAFQETTYTTNKTLANADITVHVGQLWSVLLQNNVINLATNENERKMANALWFSCLFFLWVINLSSYREWRGVIITWLPIGEELIPVSADVPKPPSGLFGGMINGFKLGFKLVLLGRDFMSGTWFDNITFTVSVTSKLKLLQKTNKTQLK